MMRFFQHGCLVAALLGCTVGSSSRPTSDAGAKPELDADLPNPADSDTAEDGGGPNLTDSGADRSTFFVEGREIFNPEGRPVLLRGVNKMNIWTDRSGDSFSEIARTGANTVRVVWAAGDGAGYVATVSDLETLVERAVAANLIPMVELHHATGNFARLDALVDMWTAPEMVSMIARHQRYFLLNIANEAAEDTVSLTEFAEGYRDAISRLRGSGIQVPLVIDAPNWGKDLDGLNEVAPALLAHDPLRNVIFSAHLYWARQQGADADFIRSALQRAVEAGYALIIGEFSRYGAWAQGQSVCSAAGEVDYQAILAASDALSIGWYAWEWGPGNAGGGDPLCDVMDMTSDSTFVGLKPGWATEVVNRIAATATPWR